MSTNQNTKKILFNKPILVSSGTELNNLVGVNPLLSESTEDKPSSPRLMNWVEPYLISGYTKTLFYTEVNSGLSVGDRVFIIGGNYDSNDLISKDKYKKGKDGYKILYIDRCIVVLDIDYTGVSPWNEISDDNFVNVYYIRNRQDFRHANRQITTKNGVFDYKFNSFNNNIVFSDQDYLPETGWGENSGLTGSPGFYVKNGTFSWINITNQFIIGSTSIAQNTNSTIMGVKIHNYSFTYSIGPDIVNFNEGYVYNWQQAPEPDGLSGTYSTWINDSTYIKPILTKSNFRNGNFYGTFNAGLYGSPNKRINWDGVNSSWNGGTLFNTRWLDGVFGSKFERSESYVTELDSNGNPSQKVTGYNNNGRGYNFIIASEFLNSNIENGTILETVIGQTPTYSLIENYLKSTPTQYSNNVTGGYFENCRFLNGFISNSEIRNTRSINTFFSGVKSINSNYKLSIIKDSTYLSDDIIKIIGYDEFNYNQFTSFSGATHKVYKFYITKSNYERLKIRDRFYIKGLKINDGSNYPLNFFDKRFRLSTWTEYFDAQSTTFSFYKRGVEVGAFLSTPEDNKFSYVSLVGTNGTGIVATMSVQNYSLDIVFRTSDKINSTVNGIDFNFDQTSSPTMSVTQSNFLGNNLDITDAWILDSDFESGLFENSNWNAGHHINYNNDVNITIDPSIGKYYNISVATSSQSLIIQTNFDQFFVESGEDCLSPGNIVYLNSVDWDSSGTIDSFTISSQGTGYSDASGLNTTGGSGQDVVLDIQTSGGNVINVSLVNNGLGYQVGDILTINSGNFNSQITVTSTTGSITKLPDSYKIVSNILGNITLQEIVFGTQSVISQLLSNGLAYTSGAQNRWGYIYKSKFLRSIIKEGLFRRSYFSESLIENENYNQDDIELSNLNNTKSLLITDSIFRNNSNIISKATYLNSSFVSGTDIQIGGIIYNSIWNGLTFSGGVFKQGRWLTGNFTGGTFYNSRSFNNSPTQDYPYFNIDRISNYWKDGETGITLSNDRYSWQSGNFLDGKFLKSDWETGEFKGGQFISSKFYNGVISGGIIGDIKLQSSDTQIFNSTVNFTTVENADFYAKDTSLYQSTTASINWYDGIFKSGIFGSDMSQTASNSATWYGGSFNNGQFISNAKWKDGIFNGGKFLSSYGWTMSGSTNITDYTWEKGTFNGGEFGNANVATNSIWFNGDFNGGIFQGRWWNNGIFTGGEFKGSGETYSSIGGLSSSNASEFINSFSQNFYGYWNDGIVSEYKDKYIKDQKLFTTKKSAKKFEASKPLHKLQNFLWIRGTFSHPRAEMINSIWLDGAFESGRFTDSSFNPYVTRIGDPGPTFNFDDSTCYWENGIFNGGDFYISEFKNGKFIIGTAYGMIFKDGISDYMNAFNVYWEDGLWRNGNWHGSYFDYLGSITDDFTLQIIYRGMSWSSTNDCHIWNIFQDAVDKDNKISGSTNSIIGIIPIESVDQFLNPFIP